MRTAILRSLFLLGICTGIHLQLAAQQPADCGVCTCTFGNLTAQLGTATPACGTDPAVPTSTTFTLANPAANFLRISVTAGRRYSITTCAQTADTYMFLTLNTLVNNQPPIISCNKDGCGETNAGSAISFVAGVNQFLRLYVYNGACGTLMPASPLDIQISCTPSQPPVNNLPCGAYAFPPSTDCVYWGGDNLGATNANVGGTPTCGNFQGADVWFTTTVPASGLIGIQTEEGTLCAGAFQLYTATGCAGTFTPLANACTMVGTSGPTSEPAMVFDATEAMLAQGTTVYIRYWERGGNENGYFQICAYEAIRPANDRPCAPFAATPLPMNTSCEPLSFAFENAGLSGVAVPSCGNTSNMRDLWFSFQVPDPLPPNYTGITTSVSASAPVDLASAWYRLSGGCAPGNFTQIAAACSPAGLINSATVNPNPNLVEGETIYVRVWGEAPWFGSAEICAFLNQAPLNDNPCGAFPLAVNYGCIMSTYSNLAATQTSTSPQGAAANGVPNPACGGTPAADVWFTVTVPANGVVQFDTQAGGMTDAAMAVYRVLSGSCATGNLALQQVGCSIAGSGQGAPSALMPLVQVTGQTPGATLYVRVWRQTASDGTFNICARRTDNPPGNCFYTLTMNDTGGDGWGGSHVNVCINGACTAYTVTGATASIGIGVNLNQLISFEYVSVGGSQGQNSFTIGMHGSNLYSSGTAPAAGMHFNETVSCPPPTAPSGDCLGAISVCSEPVTPFHQYQVGHSGELTPQNKGCMNGEQMGVWLLLQFGPETVPCSPAAFNIIGGLQSSPPHQTQPPTNPCIFDFVIWGPFTSTQSASSICPIQQPPYRCNYGTFTSPPNIKGLEFSNTLPYSQGVAGGNMARHLVVNPGDRFMLFVNAFVQSNPNTAQQFSVQWKTPPAGFQPLASDCGTNQWVTTPPPPAPPGEAASNSCYPLPVDMLTLYAMPRSENVEVTWSTGTEQNSSHFVVERSADGLSFHEIGRVSAAGNSITTVNYSFTDQMPMNGLSYYRLNKVDLNSDHKLTNMVPVVFEGKVAGLTVFPNPANETLWLSFDTHAEEPLLWRISDASGRRVSESNFNSTYGRNLEQIPISRLDQGSYLLELVKRDGSSVGVSRFVKQ